MSKKSQFTIADIQDIESKIKILNKKANDNQSILLKVEEEIDNLNLNKRKLEVKQEDLDRKIKKWNKYLDYLKTLARSWKLQKL